MTTSATMAPVKCGAGTSGATKTGAAKYRVASTQWKASGVDGHGHSRRCRGVWKHHNRLVRSSDRVSLPYRSIHATSPTVATMSLRWLREAYCPTLPDIWVDAARIEPMTRLRHVRARPRRHVALQRPRAIHRCTRRTTALANHATPSVQSQSRMRPSMVGWFGVNRWLLVVFGKCVLEVCVGNVFSGSMFSKYVFGLPYAVASTAFLGPAVLVSYGQLRDGGSYLSSTYWLGLPRGLVTTTVVAQCAAAWASPSCAPSWYCWTVSGGTPGGYTVGRGLPRKQAINVTDR